MLNQIAFLGYKEFDGFNLLTPFWGTSVYLFTNTTDSESSSLVLFLSAFGIKFTLALQKEVKKCSFFFYFLKGSANE